MKELCLGRLEVLVWKKFATRFFLIALAAANFCSPNFAVSAFTRQSSSSSNTRNTVVMMKTAASTAGTAAATRHVAVIGGGAAGLAAARVLSRDVPDCAVTVLEKHERSLGGVWKYEPTKATNQIMHPMYRGLRTNLPKEVMQYREFPWRHDTKNAENTDNTQTKGEERSYMTHEQVLGYLKAYARHFDLERMIQYGATVEQLTVLPGTTSAFQPDDDSADEDEKWPQIRLDFSTTGGKHSQVFDAVCVCNGHYSLPATPDIPGLKEYYKGRTMHSILYDNPRDFEGQTVLCIGGRASGADVARELALPISEGGGGATHVYLSDSTCTRAETRDKVSWVPKTVAVLPDGSIQFDLDCSVTATNVDCIVFCTGYDYNFAFINDQSNCQLEASQRRVQPLYEQLWHAQYPNLALVGLPHSVVPFPLFEVQMEALARQWQHCTLPVSAKERLEAAQRDATSGGMGKPDGRVPDDTHYLGSMQWEYCRIMARYAGKLDDAMENYLKTNKALYDHSGQERKGAFPGEPDAYRETVYRRSHDDQSFEIVKSGVEDVAEIR